MLHIFFFISFLSFSDFYLTQHNLVQVLLIWMYVYMYVHIYIVFYKKSELHRMLFFTFKTFFFFCKIFVTKAVYFFLFFFFFIQIGNLVHVRVGGNVAYFHMVANRSIKNLHYNPFYFFFFVFILRNPLVGNKEKKFLHRSCVVNGFWLEKVP